jgi:D-glycero-alpha-D-manno-heptose 1-phosphate guanylyltransferase
LVGYLYEKITEYYGSRYEGAEIDYSIESEPLGTGGALRQAIATLDVEGSTILLLNGDTFFPISLEQLVREHTEARADASISLFRPQDYSRYASVITDERCRVKQFTLMRPEFTGKAIERPYGGANGGVYLFDQFWLRNSLSAFPSRVFSLEIDFFPSVLSSGDKVFAFPFYNYFCDIGVPEDYLRANHELSEKGTYGN